MKYSLWNLIDECRQLLDVGAHFSALSIALMLPAICSRIEFADSDLNEYKVIGCDVEPIKVKKKNGKFNDKESYIAWLDKHGCPHFPLSVRGYKHETDPFIMTAESVYALRCMMLHEGKPFLDNKKVELVVDPNGHGISTVVVLNDKIFINMKELCEWLLTVVRGVCQFHGDYTSGDNCFDIWSTTDSGFCYKYGAVLDACRQQYLSSAVIDNNVVVQQ